MKAVFAVALLALVVCAAAANGPKRILLAKSCAADSTSCYVSHWRQGLRSQPSKVVPLVIAVKQKNTALMTAMLDAIADPKSPSYRNYLSFEEIGAMFGNEESVSAVENWLIDNGITNFSTNANGDFVRVSLTIAEAEKLLHTHYYTFHSTKDESKTISRTHRIYVPTDVAEHIDFIGYTTRFPSTHSRGPIISSPKSLRDAAAPTNFVSPQSILSTYNVADPVIKNGATQGVFESLKQYYSESDLSQFFGEFNLTYTKVAKVIGPNDPSNPGGEASLDVQYIMAVAQGAPTTFWSLPADNQEPFLDWAQDIANTASPPLVHSVSYGDVEEAMDATIMRRFDAEIQKLGLRGITVLISSGDDGVGNFISRGNATNCGFHPSYPATSRYVIAVGATQGPESGKPERACTSDAGGIITTGGGFSTVFAQPAYQTAAVQAFLTETDVPTSAFNSKGRGYPDVAALGFNYKVVIGGKDELVSGTSASAPVFAALVSLLNDALLGAGKQPVGFFNPTLYQLASSNPEVFNDITEGENNCAAGRPPQITCCKLGFTATQGWDPVTGLGSVNFGNLLAAVLSL